MNYLVIYPGRFHPFHRGHLSSYEYLTNKYGPENVYIATSDVQAPITSPFSYADKVAMMTKLGIPASHIVQVKNPYQPKEITDNLPPEAKNDTALIFAVSAKDGDRFTFGTKKNGEPSYIQPLPEDIKQLQPLTKHAYVDVTPTVNFKVRGVDANSASEVRKMYLKGSDADRDQIITELYGTYYPELRDMFDKKLGLVERAQGFIKEARASRHPGAVIILEKMLHLERLALNEGEVISFPGKPIPPDLEQARKLAHDLIDAAHNSKGDPTQLTADIRQQLQRMGYRVRGVGRGIELVNARYGFTQLIKDFDYLEEKRIK
jgi:hypothetical protein